MSRLKLYLPDELSRCEALAPSETKRDDDMILPFRGRNRIAGISSQRTLDVLVRAQLLRDNRECPECGHPLVEPVELNDARVSRNGMPIPGTATLVGFRCCSCEIEWAV